MSILGLLNKPESSLSRTFSNHFNMRLNYEIAGFVGKKKKRSDIDNFIWIKQTGRICNIQMVYGNILYITVHNILSGEEQNINLCTTGTHYI